MKRHPFHFSVLRKITVTACSFLYISISWLEYLKTKGGKIVTAIYCKLEPILHSALFDYNEGIFNKTVKGISLNQFRQYTGDPHQT